VGNSGNKRLGTLDISPVDPARRAGTFASFYNAQYFNRSSEFEVYDSLNFLILGANDCIYY